MANYAADSVSRLIGDGTGAFVAMTALATGCQPWSVALGDLNRDGKLDLATSDLASSQASIFLGK